MPESSAISGFLPLVVGSAVIVVLLIALAVLFYNSSRRQEESNAFSSTILDTSTALIIALDAGNRVLRYNRALEVLTGYDAAEVLGKTVQELPAGLQELFQHHSGVQRGEFARERNYFETSWRQREEDWRYIAWSRNVVRDERDLRRWEVRIGIDVTERRIAEHQLQRANDDLEKRVDQRTAELQQANRILKNEIREKRQAEEKTHSAEEKYRRLFEAAPLMYVISRNEGSQPVILDCNQQFLQTTGYAYEEVVGRPLQDFYPGQNAGQLHSAGYECALQDHFFDEERDLVAKDGTHIQTVLHALPDYDDNGATIGTRAMYVNITRRKEAEAALRESIEQYRKIFDTVGDALILTDRVGNIVDANPAACRIFGFTKDEMQATSGGASRYFNYYQRAMQLGLPDEEQNITLLETVEHRKSNEALFAEVRLSPFQYLGQQHLLAAIRDITERKEAEQQIIRERDRAQIYLDIAGTMFLVLNKRGKVELINRCGCEMLGFPESAIVGKAWYQNFRPPEERGAALEEFAAEIAGRQKPKSYDENTVLTRRGERRIIAWHNALLHDHDGSIIGTLSSGMDITTQKEAQGELQQHRERLEELVVERTARLHLINQQLNAEIEERRQVESTLKESREQLRNLSLRLETAREEERTHISREIHDDLGQDLSIFLMNITWLENYLGGMDSALLEKTRTMSEMVEGTIQKMRRISQDLRPSVLDHLGFAAAISWEARRFQRRTGITCQFTNEVDDLRLDDERASALFRIFQEAMTNILRHSGATQIDISLMQKEQSLLLTVQDNGAGITPEQVYASKSLGLLGMRERVRFINGTFEIQGVAGEGTTVLVTVPLTNQGLIQ